MKVKHPILILFLFILLTGQTAAVSQPDAEPWWQVELTISVTGTYQYNNDNYTHDGQYSLGILLEAALEYDISKDFLLYGGESKINAAKWKEIVYTEDGDINTMDLSRTIHPVAKVNYVLKERGELCFDFEMFLKMPTMETTDPFREFLLPRSELNKTINKKDRYNKNITAGSNRLCIPEKLILDRRETEKTFQWQWKRKKNDFLNEHKVELKIKITRKER